MDGTKHVPLAEEVDWFLATRRLKMFEAQTRKTRHVDQEQITEAIEEVNVTDSPRSLVVLNDLSVASLEALLSDPLLSEQDVDSIISQAASLLRHKVSGSDASAVISRELVECCSMLGQKASLGLCRHILIPLVIEGTKGGCDLAEKVLMAKYPQGLADVFVALVESQAGNLSFNDFQVNFWQRVFFSKSLSPTLVTRLVQGMETIPSGSNRVPGAIFALTKHNGGALMPYVAILISVVERGTGAMVNTARKSLKALVTPS